MKALILCAGRGERLKPLTDTIPKPMVPINNKPLLEYSILLCKKHGITEIAINTSYLPEKIKEYFGNGEKFGVNINYSYEPELLGTSGALNNFLKFLDETFLVFYGDAITDINVTEMLNYHKNKKSLATLALRKKPKENETQSLIFADNNLKLTKFIEKPNEEQVQELAKDYKLINSGIYILEPQVLKYIPEGFSDFAYDIFPKLIEQGKEVHAFLMDNYYFREIGKIDKYELVKNEIESGKIKLNFLNSENNKIKMKEKSKAVFLDRDGTINENLYEVDGKIMSPANLEQLKILPNVKQGILELKKQGFKIISVTNQPGVAFGYLLSKKLEEINNFLKKELGIDEIYSCIHHPKDNCECRKPNPALILQAAKDFNIDITNSYMVGDSLSDIQTGNNAKVKKTFLLGIIREDVLAIQHQKNIFPDYTCKELVEVAEKIKEIESWIDF